ncbi:MAG: low molecular weight phosphotyrosine protein phosphatase [Lachnospiraceae bacterium]|nr:low molecular weight phosphotyrosine protein phosphatase [Lachnospiraceae bacterium]
MIRILFICHGNICRSVMAEYILKKRVRDNSLSDEIFVDSAATSAEEIGNPIYPPAEKTLKSHAIPIGSHRARQVVRADYPQYDMIIAMDRENVRNLQRIFGSDPGGKIRLISEYASFSGEVEDPWYTGNFEKVYRQINDGCEGLMWSLRRIMREL